jgi:hypothetical protein
MLKGKIIRLERFVIQYFAYANLPGWQFVRELKLTDKLNMININVKPTQDRNMVIYETETDIVRAMLD